ncbi:MAG: HD domain-containing protein, partial [Chloracidobacterium sp.]|nr:HD domain-containing protein [Chloracidobacterium sp.]
MQAQQAILTFNDAEKSLGGRLLKIAIEIDQVEGYGEPHAIAIAWTAEKIGTRMGLHGIDLSALKFAALSHDMGERAMKRDYLLRPGELSWEETLDLWRHPILGEQAASELKLPRQTQLLIRWHHEWWNGGGYPDGLAGDAIPPGARILRAVDSYFALISDRPHRRRLDKTEAEQIIADMAGIEFDPQVAK